MVYSMTSLSSDDELLVTDGKQEDLEQEPVKQKVVIQPVSGDHYSKMTEGGSS